MGSILTHPGAAMTRFVSAAILLLQLGPPAFGQIAGSTSLVGTVSDFTGKSVPKAIVIATNTGTEDSHKTITNDEGYYTIQFVRVGKYEITVQRTGFQTYKATEIEVNVNEVVRTDVVLRIGELLQTVTVDVRAGADQDG
jgi:phosphatidate phosphatase APP1